MKILLLACFILCVVLMLLVTSVLILAERLPNNTFSFTSFVGLFPNGQNEVYARDWMLNLTVKITKDNSDDLDPVWSPDNKKIAFDSNREGHFQIYIFDFANGMISNLSKSLTDDRFPSWSPNDRYIAFWSRPVQKPFPEIPNPTGNIKIVNLYNSNVIEIPIPLKEASDGKLIWSPKGRYLTFTRYEERGLEIYVYDMTAHAVYNISNHPSEDWYPAWSPDENLLSFMSQRDGIGNKIYLVDITTGSLRMFSDPKTYDDTLSAWSPNGQSMAVIKDIFINDNGRLFHNWQIDIRDISNGIAVLSSSPFSTSVDSLKWSSDGRYIWIEASPRDGESIGGIYQFNVTNGDLKKIFQTKGYDRLGEWANP